MNYGMPQAQPAPQFNYVVNNDGWRSKVASKVLHVMFFTLKHLGVTAIRWRSK